MRAIRVFVAVEIGKLADEGGFVPLVSRSKSTVVIHDKGTLGVVKEVSSVARDNAFHALTDAISAAERSAQKEP